MTWAKLDDQMPDHPKVVEAGPLASWLNICGICYCSRYLTDGFIPAGQIRRLADVDNALALAQRLVEVGMWEVAEGGYRVHDYLTYNPSAESVRRERAKTAERQANFRGRNPGYNDRYVHRDTLVTDGVSNGESNAVTTGVSNAVSAPSPSPSPSPSPGEVCSEGKVISYPFAAEPANGGADAPSQAARANPVSLVKPVNPLWDALVEVFGYSPMTQPERNKWGKIVKNLRAAQATPADVHKAKTNYDAGVELGVYTWSLTPNALDTHLGELLQPPRAPMPGRARASPGHPSAVAAARHAARNGEPVAFHTADETRPVGW